MRHIEATVSVNLHQLAVDILIMVAQRAFFNLGNGNNFLHRLTFKVKLEDLTLCNSKCINTSKKQFVIIWVNFLLS